MKLKLTIALAASLGLSSCYFNSAGHILDNIGYGALAKAEDAKPGRYVYTDGSKYYVELPRYRTGKRIVTQYFIGDEDNRGIEVTDTGKTDVFEIPEDFAMYLTGKNSSPETPSFMRKVDEKVLTAAAVTRLSIVRPGDSSYVTYKYKSNAAAWWWTAGILDWLCVDIPVTCVENSLALVGVAAASCMGGGEKSNASPSGSAEVDSHFARLREMKKQVDQRGYITKSEFYEAANLLDRVEEIGLAQEKFINEKYNKAQDDQFNGNAGAGLLVSMAGGNGARTAQMLNARERNEAMAMGRKVTAWSEEYAKWADWLSALRSTGRVR